MKNFRKVLALILVVATLFSFTAMASAKEYTDAETISADYTEAVDVLSAIGILNGYTDGTFKPTNNIRRDEMAKMVAVLSNAGDDVSSLYASACTFADAKNNWAASYIAYCAQTGVIAGRSSTTFDPEANVTGLETAKMLLCVLGFDAKEQGYVGANWAINVLRDAKNFGLLNGFAEGYVVSKAITRQEAAHMFLNALQSPIVVGTVSDNIVKISNALYRFDADDEITLIDAEKYGWVRLYGNVIVSNQILADIYKGLDTEPAQDCYGRPGYAWTITNDKGTKTQIGFYALSPDFSSHEYVDFSKVLSEEFNNKDVYSLTVYVDGQKSTYGCNTFDGDEDMTRLQSVPTGHGVETEVFVNDVARTIIVTVKNTYIGQVVVTPVNERYNQFQIDGKRYSNKDYGFVDGDIILYWVCNGTNDATACKDQNSSVYYLHDAQVAEPTTAKVTNAAFNTTAGYEPMFIAGGKDYYYAENYQNNLTSDLDASYSRDGILTLAKEQNLDIYTDLYGYVMYMAEHVDARNYGYAYVVENSWVVTNWTTNTAGNKDWKITADLVDFTGKTLEDVQIDYNMLQALKADTARTGNGMVVLYELVDDVYTLVLDGNNNPVVADYYADGKLTKGESDISAAPLNGGASTKYLVRTLTADGYVYTAFEGFRAVDKDYVGKGEFALQAFDTDKHVATYVFMDASYTTYAQDFFVLSSTALFEASSSDISKLFPDYKAFSALVDGEPAIVMYDGTEQEAPTVQTLYRGGLIALNIEATDPYTKEKYPLYVQVQAATAVEKNHTGFVIDVVDGLVELENETGAPTKAEISEDGLTVYVVMYKDGAYVGVKEFDETNYPAAAYNIAKVFVTYDGTGVSTIYAIETEPYPANSNPPYDAEA